MRFWKKDNRRSKRKDISLKAQLVIGDDCYFGRTENISGSGVCFITDRAINCEHLSKSVGHLFVFHNDDLLCFYVKLPWQRNEVIGLKFLVINTFDEKDIKQFKAMFDL
jgi:hypothetical protein